MFAGNYPGKFKLVNCVYVWHCGDNVVVKLSLGYGGDSLLPYLCYYIVSFLLVKTNFVILLPFYEVSLLFYKARSLFGLTVCPTKQLLPNGDKLQLFRSLLLQVERTWRLFFTNIRGEHTLLSLKVQLLDECEGITCVPLRVISAH